MIFYIYIFSYVTKPAETLWCYLVSFNCHWFHCHSTHLGDIWGHQECLDNLSCRCDVIWCQFLRDGGQDLGVASERLYIRWASELRWRRNSLYFLPAWVVVTVCSKKRVLFFSLTCFFCIFLLILTFCCMSLSVCPQSRICGSSKRGTPVLFVHLAEAIGLPAE